MTPTVTLCRARLPHGLRVYAIGDVHGEADALATILDDIQVDLRRRPVCDWRVVLTGDYIDRGPESRSVLRMLAGLGPQDRTYCLRGNHEQCLLDVIADPEAACLYPWLLDGGLATLGSYGIDATLAEIDDAMARAVLRIMLIEALSPAEAGFLSALPHGVRFGGYFFAHAGIRPGVALEAQRPRDLMFIREPFLDATHPHPAVVVHGHGTAAGIAGWGNRIALGSLDKADPAALVLEGATAMTLRAGDLDGLAPDPAAIPAAIAEAA